MFTVSTHAATSAGGPFAPAMAERRDTGPHDVARLVVRPLSGPGDMP